MFKLRSFYLFRVNPNFLHSIGSRIVSGLLLRVQLQRKASALPPLRPRKPLSLRDDALFDQDVPGLLLVRVDDRIETQRLVRRRRRPQISRCKLKISFALFLFVVRNRAKSPIQPVVAVRLDEPPTTDPKAEVMRQDVGGRQIGSDQVQQRG